MDQPPGQSGATAFRVDMQAHKVAGELQALFELSPVAMACLDEARRFLRVNPALCTFTGYTEGELCESSLLDIIHPEDRAATGGFQDGAERRYLRKDGSVGWGSWRVALIGDREGSTPSTWVFIEDITLRKNAEAMLDESQRKLQFMAALGDLARELDDPIDIIQEMTNVVGKRMGVARCAYTEASDEGRLVTFFPGYSAAGVKPIVGTFPLAGFGQRVVREVHAGKTLVFHDVANEIAPADGADAILGIDTHAFIACPILKAGRFRGTLFVSHTTPHRWTAEDVSLLESLSERLWATVARARAEAALRDSEEQMRLATEAAQVGMWFWDLPADRMSWTPICRRLFGIPHGEEISYARFLQAVHPEDRQRTDEAVQRALRESDDLRIEYRVVWPDGSIRVIAATGRCDRDAEGSPLRMMGVVTDVTSRTEMEEARKRLEVQLRQSQKLEALGTLAGGIAHDFNNILTAVSGNLRLAIEDLPPQHPAQGSLAACRSAAERAADLVKRILAFGRPSPAERHALDLRPVVEETSRLLRAALPTMIEIRTDVDPGAPLVLADATEIHQALMNLGTNARDAMKADGGVLTLRIEGVQVDARLCQQVPDLRPGRHLHLQVSDTGEGMNPATLERIYEPFFTTKPPGQGTGLGLSVVHGIVRSHGGGILVSSQPGQGTRFDIYLPALSGAHVRAKAPASSPLALGLGERLLYVDDEPVLVQLAIRTLGRLGYAVTAVSSGQEALATFSRAPADFDLVITDLGMPDMSGLHLAKELLHRRPDLPIILTSGNVRPEDEQAARSLGVRGILLKPFSMERLGAMLRQHLAVAAGCG